MSRIAIPVFVYSDINENLRELLRARIDDVSFYETGDAEGSRNAFTRAAAVMGNPPSAWFDGQLPNLKFWQLDSAGFDQYKGVQTGALVANMGDFFSLTCAETIIAGIIAFYRRIPELAVLQRDKKWVGKPLRYGMDTLSGKRVIILGAGTIALHIEGLLTGFKCDVSFVARKNPRATIHSKEELLRKIGDADIVINTLPGAAGQYVTAEVFNAMADGAIYASVGRGSTTDEAALIGSLTSGKLGGAILDVTEQEPLPVGSPLWELPQVVLTQHTGGGHRLEDEGKVDQFLRNLDLFTQGKEVENRIELSRGY